MTSNLETLKYVNHLASCMRGALNGQERATMDVTRLDAEAIQRCANMLSSAVETTPNEMWTIYEKLADGRWVRCSMGQWWERNEDAHEQCEKLQIRFPKRLFGVRSSAVKTSPETPAK